MATTPRRRRWRGALAPQAHFQRKMNVTRAKATRTAFACAAVAALGAAEEAWAERGECLMKGQATKGARWMPWRHGPMKDVARLRKASASCLAS